MRFLFCLLIICFFQNSMISQTPSGANRIKETVQVKKDTSPVTARKPNTTIQQITPAKTQIPGKATAQQKVKLLETIDKDRGKILFQRSCASCHTINKDMTGPALHNVRSRVPAGIIYRYLQNPDSSAFKRDAYFKSLRTAYPSGHPVIPMTEIQLKSILSYVDEAATLTAGSGSSERVIAKTTLQPESWGNLEKGQMPLKLGMVRFYFATDSIMQVGTRYAANLVLSSSLESLQEELQRILSETTPDNILSKDLNVLNKYIDARLVDASEGTNTFTIEEPLEKGFRKIDSNQSIRWTWYVTPTNANPKGILEIGLYYSDNKQTKEIDAEKVDEEHYTVEVKAVKASVGSKVGNFFEKNWQWLASVIIIPLFIYWYSNRKKGRKGKRA